MRYARRALALMFVRDERAVAPPETIDPPAQAQLF